MTNARDSDDESIIDQKKVKQKEEIISFPFFFLFVFCLILTYINNIDFFLYFTTKKEEQSEMLTARDVERSYSRHLYVYC